MSGETGFLAPHAGMAGIAEARLSAANLAHNLSVLRSHAPVRHMAMVKADGYGHGLEGTAAHVVAAGADWLGVATLAEALDLRHRAKIVDTPILAVFFVPHQIQQLREAIAADVDVSVAGIEQLEAVAEAARVEGRRARVHWKVDTGITRGGAVESQWPGMAERLRRYVDSGDIETVALWSHFARAEEGDVDANTHQKRAFARAWEVAGAAGLSIPMRHFANSAAILVHPDAHFDMVRPGIALYGSNPVSGHNADFRPTMELRSHVSLVKRVPRGAGVGYGHIYRLAQDTTTALVPLGYADGIPRSSSGQAHVLLRDKVRPIIGRVSMDQVVVDCGDDTVAAGDPVVFFGAGTDAPGPDDWARWSGTIANEIFTGIGSRVPRRWVD